MRIFAVSDVHVDYDFNARWLKSLSSFDYRDDALILAGDITHDLTRLTWCLSTLAMRFKVVLFVPGNHDLWVIGEGPAKTSLQKFGEVVAAAQESGASMQPYRFGATLIVPLLGWYDYSFGELTPELSQIWMDFHACRWPEGFGIADVARHFMALNRTALEPDVGTVITFSHFVPRLDLIYPSRSDRHPRLEPVLGSAQLDRQLRQLSSRVHVYGHSHVNRRVCIDGVTYINNAFGYPGEAHFTSRRLVCIKE